MLVDELREYSSWHRWRNVQINSSVTLITTHLQKSQPCSALETDVGRHILLSTFPPRVKAGWFPIQTQHWQRFGVLGLNS